MKSQFYYLNPNVSFEILISVMESRFHYLNPNLSFQILISVMKMQFQYLNPNFSIQILISLMKSQFQLQSPIFSVTIFELELELELELVIYTSAHITFFRKWKFICSILNTLCFQTAIYLAAGKGKNLLVAVCSASPLVLLFFLIFASVELSLKYQLT